MSRGSQSTRLGIMLCLCALLSFVIQDAFTKILIVNYDAAQLVMIRFWAFAIFATVFATSRTGLRRSLFIHDWTNQEACKMIDFY